MSGVREVSRDPWCKHRTAFDDKKFPVCKAGVNYHEFKVAGEYGKYYGDQMPCLGRSVTDAKTRCQKFENWTREEIDARRRKVEATMDRIRKAMAAIMEAADGKRGVGGQVTCPNCSKPLHYSIARVNGHIHAKCETPHCVSFMQ